MKNKILFIDRDGTIISETVDFKIDNIKKLNFEPYVICSLFNLQRLGYKLIMVTNQDGLGTRKLPKRNFYIPHNMMIKILKSQKIFFKKIFICPHNVSDNCLCRKPKTKLINYYLKKNLIDKKLSYVIGDRDTDIKFAENIGIKGLKYNIKTLNWQKIFNIILKNNKKIK